MKFYMIDQNNSGGSFVVDDKLCHRIIIEANSEREALDKAEDLGCYWDGVEDGSDCRCCGDRWNECAKEIDLDKYKEEGYEISLYGKHDNQKEIWMEKYGDYAIHTEPELRKHSWNNSKYFAGDIYFKTIEDYAQFMANEWGCTSPDARIYYADGTVTSIFSERVEQNEH